MSSSTCVLLAIADPELRAEIQEILEPLAWELLEAEGGPAIVEVYRDKSPKIVLVSMGGEHEGAELCRTLRLLPGSAHTALVGLVEELGGAAVPELLEAGADDVLPFSCPQSLLIHRLERALRDPIRSSEPEEEPNPTGDWLETLSQDIEQVGDHHLAVISLSTTLAASPGGTEPSAGTEASLEGRLPERIQRAISAFESSGAGAPARADARSYPLGGGRFMIIVPRLERIQDAAKLANLLQEHLRDVYLIDGEEYHSVVNLGISSSPGDGRDATELVKRAETACYCSRQEGGSNSQFYAESMSRWAFERLTLERSLREAVDRDEMEVYYQPRVSISDRSVIGFEALVRWNHPQLGLVSPGQFIPLAEETGLIVPIGEWVLRTACQQARDWQDQGFEPVRISVNLSAEQFRQERLEMVVKSVLEETGLEPQWLELEVTESMLMTDAEATVRTLQDLKAMGVHLSIDDFGTGYSSLSYLKRFPIDALKIDRSFVRDVTTNPDDAAIATSIILMGHSLRLSVVAEGVEEERQLSFLQVLQCNEAQGFLFSPPVPAGQAETFLRRAAAA